MNVIEKTKEILEKCPSINKLFGEINVDFSSTYPESYGLSSVGDSIVSEDILGNQLRQHSFLLYSTFSGINDLERLRNSGVILEISQYLDGLENIPVDNGFITKITSSNGTIYEVLDENSNDILRYQIQITVNYKLER